MSIIKELAQCALIGIVRTVSLVVMVLITTNLIFENTREGLFLAGAMLVWGIASRCASCVRKDESIEDAIELDYSEEEKEAAQ